MDDAAQKEEAGPQVPSEEEAMMDDDVLSSVAPELIDFAARKLAGDELVGVVKAAVMCFTWIDDEGEEMITVIHTADPASTRAGMVLYLDEWHRAEMRGLFYDE